MVNAIYFKGNWKYQFQPEKTETQTFHVDQNRQVQYYMVKSIKNFKVLKNFILQQPFYTDVTSFINDSLAKRQFLLWVEFSGIHFILG